MERVCVYTLIDLFSRWAYAEVAERIGAKESARFILRARKVADFNFEMIQTDHGSDLVDGTGLEPVTFSV